jgi:RimJ/RimL family protein N-acetyltransferase
MYPRDVIETERLVLVPIRREQCQALLAGEDGGLSLGEGWPIEGSLVNMRTAERFDVELPGWFVTLDGAVIGDISTHGEMDEDGNLEVGYNLAEPYRGNRYAPELVAAVCEWLARRDGVRRLTASGVESDNIPSRKTLERVGFSLLREEDGLAYYVRETEPVSGSDPETKV